MSSSVQESVQQMSSSVQESVQQMSSSVQESVQHSSSSVHQTSSNSVQQLSSSIMEESKSELSDESGAAEKLKQLISEKFEVTPKDFGDLEKADIVKTEEHSFSSSSSSHQASVTKVSTTGQPGEEPVVQIEESSTSEKSCAVSSMKAVDGEVVESAESAELSREEIAKTAIGQGDQLKESSAVLTENAGINIKDGEVVSSHQNTSLIENTDGGHELVADEKSSVKAEDSAVMNSSMDDEQEKFEAVPVKLETSEQAEIEKSKSRSDSASADEREAPQATSDDVENLPPPEDLDLPPPPPPTNEDFPPPPPMEDELPPPVDEEDVDGGSAGNDPRSSYAALVTPSGFVSPTRDETDANRRSFTSSLLASGGGSTDGSPTDTLPPPPSE
eukprot:TRINITY_DN30734_c0_g2_i1.p1 TRINITY_DN30734_c0_g2~~TRINITY_DN30734_c0_g2_i1.p1  ORF type:complete len:388 (-),score=110.94 TRINITY_DN30734_c0_g2_i1:332-1495(-)